MPVNARNAHRIESATTAAGKNAPMMNGSANSGKELSEEERLQAVLNASNQNFKSEQEAMSHKPTVRSYNKSAPVPDKPLPPGYICHRCGEKGHWIQACPTNNDPNFDNRPKFKRTTGIPRSFLKVVEKPSGVGEDGKPDLTNVPKGVMYTANGEWVVAEADHATWDKIQEKQNAAAAKATELSSEAKEIRDRGLECSIHKGIFNEPVKTPCCHTTYCLSCAEDAILTADLSCPNCGEQVLLDNLEPDEETIKKIKEFEEEKKRKHLEVSKSPAKAATPAVESSKNDAAGTPHISRKRSAEEELPNDRKPSNPPAQPRQEFDRQMQAMQASMSGMQNVPATMNPMYGFNPAMDMGQGMGMNMNFGMGMQNYGGYGMPMNGGMGQTHGWNSGMPSGNSSNETPYMRQPINPGRKRQNKPRSHDYKQV